ncbi:2-C-methyl-D-erythritol 4-phosphate cytidylyltransferase [Pedobacter duraquae]|uniref:2-C-methyl-D-erythritol 4-phosphate cytidylyltransferase n=1 Tax=Pedobacter duraquae TaxID=425511 RepID=A0A4R6IGP7_9SPHI|nr:2-C-methyl-D-erythritol 4-phosphate cytidylyltransferase [Pedobacter duraquae]TDO21026.1 2-C-methyl-D-erythritol 4-phosphate cytidylyltransferase [Pedobacter duraquae]
MKNYAIIVAGGKGSRMNSAIPKQFMVLEGKPVMMHTIETFYKSAAQPEIIVVLNIHLHHTWDELCTKYGFEIPHTLVKGGAERFHSVKNGLKLIKGKACVAIHDAVRPLVSKSLIEQSFEAAAEKGNAVTGVTPTDSVRQLDGKGKTRSLQRAELMLIQTPQTFNIELLRKAYQEPFRNEFTDDASVVEFAGYDIHIIPGERENIKITQGADLELAALYLKKKASE